MELLIYTPDTGPLNAMVLYCTPFRQGRFKAWAFLLVFSGEWGSAPTIPY